MRGLAKRFAPLDAEVATKALADFMAFKRHGRESVDEVLTRYEHVRFRAQDQGGIDPGPSGVSFMLLSGMGISPEEWIQLLQPFGNNLPTTEEQYQMMLGLIRRRGHLFQHASIAQVQHQAGCGHAGQKSNSPSRFP